ncbi:hypothetical protein C791_8221 [Amycolatopsis azurea DSM 43854]|uniref:Uncharacterized protein n=1 Tax=Amycolatopsis azurea DSM 43854 TaxID=1238180 RepID=M2Q7E3_9PSEU|nr:hypothetical protein C791_8221 [Amycolatopsis azurea DSM 43854]
MSQVPAIEWFRVTGRTTLVISWTTQVIRRTTRRPGGRFAAGPAACVCRPSSHTCRPSDHACRPVSHLKLPDRVVVSGDSCSNPNRHSRPTRGQAGSTAYCRT